jgi:hypothetical protein
LKVAIHISCFPLIKDSIDLLTWKVSSHLKLHLFLILRYI